MEHLDTIQPPKAIEYSISLIWDYLEQAEQYVPWKSYFPGSPHYHSVCEYVLLRLTASNRMLSEKIKNQIEYNRRYEYDHFEELR